MSFSFNPTSNPSIESSALSSLAQQTTTSHMLNIISSPPSSNSINICNQSFKNQSYFFNKHEISALNPSKLFFRILYAAMTYVRKAHQRSVVDDGILMQQLAPHIQISDTMPVPLTDIGQRLLTDGYVLIAYGILIARMKKSIICYQYLTALFEGYFDIVLHQEEFKTYLQQGAVKLGLKLQKREGKKKKRKQILKQRIKMK